MEKKRVTITRGGFTMKQERIHIIENQPRAYCEGMVEKINGEWVFFDHETEDAFPLDDFIYKEIQGYSFNVWNTGILTENYIVQYDHTQYNLQDQDWIKVRKTLTISYQSWLEELHQEAFFQFVRALIH